MVAEVAVSREIVLGFSLLVIVNPYLLLTIYHAIKSLLLERHQDIHATFCEIGWGEF